MPQSADVIVVGAGHNGLVAACYQARAGLDVLVLEAHQRIGGMTTTNAAITEAPEHRVNDASIEATVFRISRIPAELQLGRFGLRQVVLDPQHAYLDRDGDSLCLWRDPRRTAEEIRRFSRHDAEAWLDFAAILDSAVDVAVPFALANPTRPSLRTFLAAAHGFRRPRRLALFGRLATTSLAEMIDERFRHPFVRGVVAGLSGLPTHMCDDGTALSSLYLGIIQRYGLSRFIGGTGALPAALGRCLEEAGGRIRTSARVEALLMESGRVTGVRLATGEELHARAVLTACSPKTTLTQLLPAGVLSEDLQARADHIPTTRSRAGSLKVDVALKGRLELPRHQGRRSDRVDLRIPMVITNTFDEYLRAWDLAVRGDLPEPPPTMTCIPTAADPSQAPAGQDTLWSWSGIIPNEPREPWATVRERAGKALVKHLASFYDGIEEMELGRVVKVPPDLATRFFAIDGNPMHVDMFIRDRHGPLRPARGFGGYRTPVPGLFLTGAGTHPVGGITGIPGKLAANVVMHDLRSSTPAVGKATRWPLTHSPAANSRITSARRQTNRGAEQVQLTNNQGGR